MDVRKVGGESEGAVAGDTNNVGAEDYHCEVYWEMLVYANATECR